MNRIGFYLTAISLLILFSCQKEAGNKPKTSEKKPKKYSFVVKRDIGLASIDELKQDKVLASHDFFKIIESFQPESFSLEELIDLTDKDLKLLKKINSTGFHSSLDTASVKSRMVLTEVYLQKLKYLVHKKTPRKDTIAGTLKAIVMNLNNVIKQMKIYNDTTDEFESILKHDSIARQERDFSLDTVRGQKPRISRNVKKPKFNFIKKKFPGKIR